MNIIITIPVILPFIFAALIPLSAIYNRKLSDILGCLATFILMVLALLLYMVSPLGSFIIYGFQGSILPLGITFVMDGLSHLLILIISTVSFIVAVYSVPYMEKYTSKRLYWSLFMLMIGGMCGAVLAGDLISLYIFIELASIASAALVAFGTEAEETEASMKYLIMGGLASMFILLGIAILYGATGTVNMAEVARKVPMIPSPALKSFVAMLFIVGFGTKTALVPFHSWLPDAHPAAPAPISAMLSGVLIKALGMYALIRLFFNILGITQGVSNSFLLLGALSILVGSFLAFGQKDMKRMMACSSISQIGYIITGIGLATPLGVMAGLLHLFNHALLKPLLFLTAGSVEHATGTRDMEKLGNLRETMPVTSGSSLIGSLAISGVPPFNAFWSKLFIIFACVQTGHLVYAAVAVAGSIFTLAYFLRMQKLAFFGPSNSLSAKAKEVPLPMLFSMVALVLLCLLSGLFFTHVTSLFINPAVVAVAGGSSYSRMIMGGM